MSNLDRKISILLTNFFHKFKLKIFRTMLFLLFYYLNLISFAYLYVYFTIHFDFFSISNQISYHLSVMLFFCHVPCFLYFSQISVYILLEFYVKYIMHCFTSTNLRYSFPQCVTCNKIC